MDRYTCNLCFRRFSNGRALGGHMRSHVISAGPSARPRHHGYSSDSTSSGQAVAERAAEEEEEVGLSYGLRMNPRKSFRLVDPEFSSFLAAAEPAGSCVVVQDRESETESPRAHRPRTKRPRRAAAASPDQPASSVSDATPEEDVALCLMMLSRDSWATGEEGRPSGGSDDEDGDEDNDRRAAARSRHPPPRRGRSRYQCGACKKVFRSYQALGGHRASHKRTNGCVPAVDPRTNREADSVDSNADAKVHECPFCFRVFSSGQALGGHKRSHFTSSATAVANNSPSSAPPPPCSPPSTSPVRAPTKCGSSFNLIDLNLPAPTEDDVEMSAVSDMDFVANPTAS